MFHPVVVLRMQWPLYIHEFIYSVLYNFLKNFQCIIFELGKAIMVFFFEKLKRICFLYNNLNSIAAVMPKDC